MNTIIIRSKSGRAMVPLALPLPPALQRTCKLWRSQLDLLTTKHISKCYYPKDKTMSFMELHGFSDASQAAYAGVIYLRMIDTAGLVDVALVTSKTKVAHIKQLSIPSLELCGAHLLTDLLNHFKVRLHIPLDNIYAWTDSTVVLSWIVGNPRRFKAFVANHVSCVVELVPPDK